jgi:hypothetical protein
MAMELCAAGGKAVKLRVNRQAALGTNCPFPRNDV